MKKPPHGITRRSVIRGISASALLPLLSGNLAGCSSGSGNGSKGVPATFEHGIASGDPMQDRVILWTRVTPESEGKVVVDWEVAADESFGEIVAKGSDTTTAEVDYTFKVDAEGLAPGTDYYYRFRAGDQTSVVGRTRTAPAASPAAASFAVVSCANYPVGFFNVYREVANQELDAVLHLGDYIYEYGADGYASDRAAEFGRVVEPETEIISLADYRARYAQYHTDADLQVCHARHPFILVWDDHEVANNAWRNGAENHDPASEGDFSERRAAAIQAWYEWLPVRPPTQASEIIYRSFSYGDLLDLIMLDTRNVGRDKQVDYADYLSGGVIDSVAVRAATSDSNRTMLGTDQLAWLQEQLVNSTARWQVLGQQVLMARQPMPEPIVRPLATSLGGSLEEATGAVLAAFAAKQKAPEDRTPEEQMLLDSAIPFNPDAWDGYAYEREVLLEQARQLQSRLVVFAGDTHNAWASQLTTADGTVVGVELAGPSVTSPGAEAVLGASNAALFGPLAETLIDDLRYTNLVERGYLRADFSPDAVVANWVFVSAIDTPDYQLDEVAGRMFTVDRENLLLG